MPKVYVTGEGQEARAKVAFDLDRLEVTIGRAEDNDLVISDDGSISSYHCVILRVFGGYVIKDLGSSNGILKDGVKEEKIALEHGMELKVGDSPMTFVYTKQELSDIKNEEKDPTRYVTEGDIQELENQRKGISKPPAPVSAHSSDSAPAPVDSSSPAISPQQYAPRARAKSSSSAGSSILAFLGLIICFAIGLAGGLMYKHYQTYDGANLLDDYNGKKVKTVFE